MENATLRKQVKQTERWLELYDKQVAEYNRCKRLGVVYDNKYGTIEALDNQAVEKASLLNQYKEKLSQNATQLRMIAEQRRIEQAQKRKQEKAQQILNLLNFVITKKMLLMLGSLMISMGSM